MKNEPAANLRCSGKSASPGYAEGPIALLANPTFLERAVGDPQEESAALRAAIHQAGASLKALMSRSERQAAEILEFQLVMLEDDSLSDGAFDAIAAGIPAQHAWAASLDNEITDYLEAEDEYFRARATDLMDLKERVLDALSGGLNQSIPPGSIVIADDLSPSRFLAHDWSGGGIVLRKGSATSHVAMLARSRGVPMLVCADVPAHAGFEGAKALLNGASGWIVFAPDAAALTEFSVHRELARQAALRHARFERQPGVSADGIIVSIQINIADVAELDHVDPEICDGIGLVRTELLFEGKALPDETQQFAAYRKIAQWAKGRPVTIRTLDAGGDKPITGVTPEGESNPFLGVRGVRLTLRQPALFKTQLRALARAAAFGDVRVMIPMVAIPEELAATRALLDAALLELTDENLPHRRPALGIMVEVPSAAISIDTFDADFFSIGSNDLTQYVMAAGRDIGAVAHLADAGNPAVIALIRQVAESGRRRGRLVSLCGDAAGDPALLSKLLAAGLRSLSVAPGLVGSTKAHLAELDIGAG